MITDPAAARPRADLTFLRHRARPRSAAADPGASAAGPGSAGAPARAPADSRSDTEVRSAIADFVNGRSTHPQRAARSAAASSASSAATSSGSSASGTGGGGEISFERPGRSHGVPPVTPSRRSTAPASAPPVAQPSGSPAGSVPPARGGGISFERPAASSSLDLDAQPAPPAASPTPAGSAGALDLSRESAPPAAAAPARAAPRRPSRPQRRVPAGMSVRAGQQQLFTINDPTVVLTPVQSGVGSLNIEAVCGPDVGDLRLGAAYQLRSGPTSTVQLANNGNRFAPSSRRPVVVAGRDEYEHLRVDLRQVTDLERMAVYAFSESGAELAWGGTLLVATFGGGRVELPLEHLHPGRVAVLITIYNVDGRLVVRAEMETIAGEIREAARAYGFDRITWRDGGTPVD